MSSEELLPKINEILDRAKQLGFTMSCDTETGQLLRVLAGSKRKGDFLELGTGAGLSTLWLLDGMDAASRLISIEMDESIQHIARTCIHDARVEFISMDGGMFIEENKSKKFDLIFADTWPGKFYLLEETLAMVKPGGYYIIDDLRPIETWPDDHREKVQSLVSTMRNLEDFYVVELNCSTGLILATRK
ncbi:O-methyltransferase [Paenibacillus hexagrammi]|uniref:Class I SAM-dependent methyltransferase n=1 Tax=Paenibacillus hexagrammi TaxID=2908839 RepID=A0ABY3SPL9_9BACL|nr:class I SAM-dependent methyltransferase [Paenibacillus sp. YPD9-1]UJF35465.1 class I SAM-dependent methyltransferase [Paenibacillus sp. YPD9-1]